MTRRLQHYKSLTTTGGSMHGGTHQYDLPTQRHDGTWMPGAWSPVRTVDPCVSGWHTWTERDALSWLGPTIWRAEVRGAVDAENKYVSAQIRLTSGTCWDDRVARLYAIQCALDVLPLYEAAYPGDWRVSDCIVTAWEYAIGAASAAELQAAAEAAESAASAAAWAPAALARAAWAVAWTAARAARSAAWEAAGAAARAAAWEAARAAARAAAWNAARDAAREMQCARLVRYLDGDIPLFPEWPQ